MRAYFPGGNLRTTSLPNGTIAEYIYDDLGRLDDLIHTQPNGNVLTYDYTVLDDGSRSGLIETYDTPDGVELWTTDWGWQYDNANVATMTASLFLINLANQG